MTVAKLIETIGNSDHRLGLIGLAFLICSIFIEIVPIKFNPWSLLLGWIGSRINIKLNAKLNDIDHKVDKLNTDLDNHIAESKQQEIKNTRRDILDFCNSCMNGRKHTKEQFEFVIKQCDDYESYIEKNHVRNGVVDAAIKEIRRLNLKCIQENSYLKEGEDYDYQA